DSETGSREGGDSPGGTVLAQETVVRGPSRPVGGPSMEDSTRQNLPVPRPSPPPRSTVASVSRLEVEREKLKAEGLSAQVITTIMAARRPSTTRIYNATWNSFSKWCRQSSINPLSPSVAQVLASLQDGLDKGLSPNTLRRQVSALSTMVSGDSSAPLSHHPRIRAFLRGASNLRPPMVHRYPTWDLNKVLTALTKSPLEPLRETSLQYLTLKVVFLVAITSARRISEIAALSVRKDLCIFYPDRVILRPDPVFMPKINSAFHRAQELVLPNFCPKPVREKERQWHTLDVRRAL
ncbi:uncharacterized protein LOC113432497, partial [Notechis scutatus]|uniref:Uncharacterized protein LOC113432497 n=1 Tax=Notechis scutatus TaxID=8663 RepID=A0A6J1W5M5_9SAUR